MPRLVGDSNPYSLRNANDIQSIRVRTNLFFNSLFPSTIRAWNSLPQDIKDANTVTAFKYCLNRQRRLPPKFYIWSGKVTATDEDNETMFCHVQEFLVKSKRFLWYKGTNVTLLQIILKNQLMESWNISLSLCLSLSLCMFDVYAHACISVCMRLCTCLNACVYVCMYIRMYVHACVRMYVCMYATVYIHAYK